MPGAAAPSASPSASPAASPAARAAAGRDACEAPVAAPPPGGAARRDGFGSAPLPHSPGRGALGAARDGLARPRRAGRALAAVAVAATALLLAACGAEGQDGAAPPPRPEAIAPSCGPAIAAATPRALAAQGVALVFVEATAAIAAEASPRPVTLELVEIDSGARARLPCAERRAGRVVAYGLVPMGRWRPAAVAPVEGAPGVDQPLAGAGTGAEDELRLGAGEAMHLGRAAWTFPAGSGAPALRAGMPDAEARADARRIAPGMAPALLLRALLRSG